MTYLFFTIVLFGAVSALKKSYGGYKVYRVVPREDAAVSHLEELVQIGLGELWNDNIEVNLDVRINVAPGDITDFLKFIKSHRIEFKEVIPDIESTINYQLKPSTPRISEPFLSYTWTEYHNLKKIYAWLDELQDYYATKVGIVNTGESVLGNPIKGVVLNFNPEQSGNMFGVLVGTLHGRDWICPATVTWIIKEFLTSNNPAIRALAENIEWHIFPVANPDGYEYTFKYDRMWKKNRNPRNFTTCMRAKDEMSVGVDLNRNFDFHWMSFGASDNPCSNTFAGPSPFSEQESRAIRDYMLSINQQGKLIYFIGFHSFGQSIVIPYSHLTDPNSLKSSDHGDIYKISVRAAEAVKKKHGTEYKVGPSASTMYAMSGSSFDWVKNATKVPVSLLLQLRDNGEYGFLLPPDQIVPTATEAMDALLEMDKTTRKLAVIFASVSGVKQSYDGYKMFKVIPEDETAVSHLENLSWNGLGEFWDDNIEINKEARIIVSPDDLQNFLDFLRISGIENEEVMPDIQRTIDQQLKPATARTYLKSNLTYFWNEYQNLRNIYDWLDELQQNYSKVVKIVDKGRSVLGRSIKGIVINHHPERKKKRIGVLEGTLHARDWISAATLTWIIKEFLTSNDSAVRALAKNFEWHIFPIVNPDGYEYTFSDNRMWKKNRSPHNFTTCPRGRGDMSKGVDLNRNFDFHWMNVGIAKNPCSNSFAGPRPFSEPETRAVRDYMLKIDQEGKLIYYIGFHSYGQLIIVPHSHLFSDHSLLGSDYGEMFDISLRAAEALKKRHNTEYKVGLSSSVMYSMSGSSFDWVKNATRVSVALLFGLRDRGQYGFLLPADQIIPTAMETMDALIEMDEATRNLGYYSSGLTFKYIMESRSPVF
ncbi:unnamed protein product [Arctia plantaginis]|uniref:Peptidase M14 domain-containing protein n=1 Tax=Arctia plantaginis TaxID=874455 RepID=A0A8S1AV12_ARCPL|nr:unnamed protein product [Arctia plantaginis]